MLSAFDRRVLSMRVRQVTGRNRRKSNGPHIAVIANCQTFGVAYAMDMLLPGATVDPIQILLGNRTTPEFLAKVLRDYDYVFGLKYISTHLRYGDHTTLERLMPSIRWFPLFHFPAYHPDFLFLQGRARLAPYLACSTSRNRPFSPPPFAWVCHKSRR